MHCWSTIGSATAFLLRDDDHISGATTGTLTIRNVTDADVGTYSVFVENPIGVSVSNIGLLTVPSPPIIVIPPADLTVLPGASATFAVEAIGTQPLDYQWQNHGTNLTSGGTNKVLTLLNVTPGRRRRLSSGGSQLPGVRPPTP